MTHDIYAWLSQQTESELKTMPIALRKQLAMNVMRSGNADAKEKARNCNMPVWKDFAYHSPGMDTPFLSTGLAIQLTWKLDTPFFSRAEGEFDALDNPVSRDPLCNNPILKTAGAKGMLAGISKYYDSAFTDEFFGQKKLKDDETGRKGTLLPGDVQFLSTGHDVFVPHDRRFGVVDHPVGFEVVPDGGRGEWGIMIPSISGKDWREKLVFLLESIQTLLGDYGMSAKRSSDYGLGTDVQITFRAGKKIQIPKEYETVEGGDFKEPRPVGTERTIFKPDCYDLLVKEGNGGKLQMTCEKDDAYQTLYNLEFGSISKKGLSKKELKKLGKKKKVFKVKWEQLAEKQWDKCNEYMMVKSSLSDEEIASQQKAVADWKIRKKQHEKNRPVYYKLPLNQAISMVKEHMEVINEPA